MANFFSLTTFFIFFMECLGHLGTERFSPHPRPLPASGEGWPEAGVGSVIPRKKETLPKFWAI